MITANVLRETWKAVVEAYKEDITFVSSWSPVLDHDNDRRSAHCLWMQPQVQIIPDGRVMKSLFTVDLWFEDTHENERSAGTRDNVYERMQVVAAHCLLYYRELYCDQETIYQGVHVRLMQEGPAVFTTSYDSAGAMATGCRMTVTLGTTVQFCASDYFNE